MEHVVYMCFHLIFSWSLKVVGKGARAVAAQGRVCEKDAKECVEDAKRAARATGKAVRDGVRWTARELRDVGRSVGKATSACVGNARDCWDKIENTTERLARETARISKAAYVGLKRRAEAAADWFERKRDGGKKC